MGVRRSVVTPSGTGSGWKNTGPDGKATNHQTQEKAIERGKNALGPKGGEVTIAGRDGRFREGITVKPANDPYPPKG